MKPERIQDRLVQVPDWRTITVQSEAIEWTQVFTGFNQVIEILVQIAMLVENFRRIPEITVRGNGLTLRLGSDGLEDADFDLAEAISNSC